MRNFAKIDPRKKFRIYSKSIAYQQAGFSLGLYTVKPVLSGHSKIDKTKVLKTNGSLMKVESISVCSFGLI